MALRSSWNPYRIVPGAGGGSASGDTGGSTGGSSGQTGGSSGGGNNGGLTPTGGGSIGGGSFETGSTAGGNEVAVPAPVTFDPAAYFISLGTALDAAHKEGDYNIGKYKDYFKDSRDLAFQNLDTEATGLESYLPRTTNLIRNADRQGNEDILNYSDVFDARNAPATRAATLGNVSLRQQLFSGIDPNATADLQAQKGRFTKDVGDIRSREAADQARVRSEESKPFLSSILKEQAIRNARSAAADNAASTGFGADSSAGMSLIDKFDTNTRVQLEQLDRQDRRIGDQNIYNASTHTDASINTAEGQLTNTLVQGEQLFNSVIAPGIRDFTPIQPTPRITDIGGQIRAMPAVDAGTLQRGFTNDQANISLLSPGQVFSGSIDVQKYNSGVGIEALGFQQGLNNTAAGAVNTGLNLDKGDQQFQQQLDAFQNGLDSRNQSQGIQALTSLATGGLGVLGNLLFSGGGAGGGGFQGVSTGGGITGIGTSGTGGNVSPVGVGGGGGVGVSGGGAFSGVSGDANFGGNGVPDAPVFIGGSSGGGFDLDSNLDFGAGSLSGEGASEISASGDSFAFKGTGGGPHSLAQPATDQYMRKVASNDFKPDMSNHDYSSPGDAFDFSKVNTGYQPTDFKLNPKDVYNYDGGMGSDQNEFLPLGRVKSESSGVQVAQKADVIKSFYDSSLRPAAISSASNYGMPATLATASYDLFDTWHTTPDSERAQKASSLLRDMSDHLSNFVPGSPATTKPVPAASKTGKPTARSTAGVVAAQAAQTGASVAGSAVAANSAPGTVGQIGGSNVGAVIQLMSQGSSIFKNWDKMNTQQRFQAASGVIGSLGTIAAHIAGIGGPVGAAAAFGAGAFGNAVGTLVDTGIDGRHSFATVESPLSTHAVGMLNNLTGNRINQKDADHAALFLDPTGIGAVVAAADSIFGLDLDFTSGKPKEQKFRDSLRGYLKDSGVISSNYQMRLADGSTFDFGKDGHAKLPNVGTNIDGKAERSYFDIDWSNPIAKQVVSWADPLTRVLFRSDQGKKIIGHVVNAATNADPTDLQQAKSNLKNLAVEGGLTYAKGIQILNSIKKDLKPDEIQAFKNGWIDLMLK